jgi:hypothetical protein
MGRLRVDREMEKTAAPALSIEDLAELGEHVWGGPKGEVSAVLQANNGLSAPREPWQEVICGAAELVGAESTSDGCDVHETWRYAPCRGATSGDPAAEGDDTPDCLDTSERPGANQHGVGGSGRACECENENEHRRALFERVRADHYCHSHQTKELNSCHDYCCALTDSRSAASGAHSSLNLPKSSRAARRLQRLVRLPLLVAEDC